MNTLKNRKGFTLIEIVIVLAIAALIMVVVFIAVQGAQRGQRDQSRKDLANRAVAKTQEYRGNNNGTAPLAAQLAAYFSAGDLPTIGGTVGSVTVATAPLSCAAATTQAIVATGSPDVGYICLEAGGGTQLYKTN